MSILYELSERGVPLDPPPSLDGNEVFIDVLHPERSMVRGVMHAARKRFVTAQFGASAYERVVAAYLDVMVARHGEARRRKLTDDVGWPLSNALYSFETLIELDRTICATITPANPHMLVFLGAASAEFGIGTIYRAFDSRELLAFLQGIVLMHERFQKYGRVSCHVTSNGAQMRYEDCTCYSPVFCATAHGFFAEAILRHGGRDPHVTETTCTCRGARACTYDLEWH